MALRFRRSIKLAPGIRWNISGSGSSFTFGPRGASVSIGKRGTHLNAGIPGTGLYSRSRLDAPAPRLGKQYVQMEATCSVKEDGSLRIIGADGNPLSEHLIEQATKQNREALMGLIRSACDKVNGEVEALARIHLTTPDPSIPPRFEAEPFASPQAAAPADVKVGFFAGLFAKKREAIEAANRAARARYERGLAAWKAQKAEHEAAQARRRMLIEQGIRKDPAAMETFLEERLHAIDWPRETQVSFEIAGSAVALDVDLPEIEHMPSKVATVPVRGLKLSVKDMTATQVQRLYLGHVHGIIFRLIGEAFAALPAIDTVVASGFSQRADPKSGNVGDDYLLSVRVSREQWRALNFGNLAAVDVVEALGTLGAVRNVQRSGKLLAVQPLNGD